MVKKKSGRRSVGERGRSELLIFIPTLEGFEKRGGAQLSALGTASMPSSLRTAGDVDAG